MKSFSKVESSKCTNWTEIHKSYCDNLGTLNKEASYCYSQIKVPS